MVLRDIANAMAAEQITGGVLHSGAAQPVFAGRRAVEPAARALGDGLQHAQQSQQRAIQQSPMLFAMAPGSYLSPSALAEVSLVPAAGRLSNEDRWEEARRAAEAGDTGPAAGLALDAAFVGPAVLAGGARAGRSAAMAASRPGPSVDLGQALLDAPAALKPRRGPARMPSGPDDRPGLRSVRPMTGYTGQHPSAPPMPELRSPEVIDRIIRPRVSDDQRALLLQAMANEHRRPPRTQLATGGINETNRPLRRMQPGEPIPGKSSPARRGDLIQTSRRPDETPEAWAARAADPDQTQNAMKFAEPVNRGMFEARPNRMYTDQHGQRHRNARDIEQLMDRYGSVASPRDDLFRSASSRPYRLGAEQEYAAKMDEAARGLQASMGKPTGYDLPPHIAGETRTQLRRRADTLIDDYGRGPDRYTRLNNSPDARDSLLENPQVLDAYMSAQSPPARLRSDLLPALADDARTVGRHLYDHHRDMALPAAIGGSAVGLSGVLQHALQDRTYLTGPLDGDRPKPEWEPERQPLERKVKIALPAPPQFTSEPPPPPSNPLQDRLEGLRHGGEVEPPMMPRDTTPGGVGSPPGFPEGLRGVDGPEALQLGRLNAPDGSTPEPIPPREVDPGLLSRREPSMDIVGKMMGVHGIDGGQDELNEWLAEEGYDTIPDQVDLETDPEAQIYVQDILRRHYIPMGSQKEVMAQIQYLLDEAGYDVAAHSPKYVNGKLMFDGTVGPGTHGDILSALADLGVDYKPTIPELRTKEGAERALYMLLENPDWQEQRARMAQ